MAYDLSPEGDAAALKARRAELRAFVNDIAEIVARMPMPETYLEAERGARAVWVADRVLVRMRGETLGGEDDPTTASSAQEARVVRSPSPTSGEEQDGDASPESEGEGEGWSMPYLMTSVRLRLRRHADRLMEAAAHLEKPTCYLEGERAGRYALAADRMLGQLYAPPKVAKGFGRTAPGEDEAYGEIDFIDGQPRPASDDFDAWYALLEGRINHLTRRKASDTGFWPNGKPYVDGEPEPEEASPFNTPEYLGDLTEYTPEKDVEIRAKARVWYAETHERGWGNYSEAEQVEVVARIEADWDKGRLRQRAVADSQPSHLSPLEGRGWPEGPGEGLSAPCADGNNPSSAASRHLLPSSGEKWENNGPPHQMGETAPAIRVVESVFAPNRFGRRTCDCSLSAPKCNGPCPIPP